MQVATKYYLPITLPRCQHCARLCRLLAAVIFLLRVSGVKCTTPLHKALKLVRSRQTVA